MICGKEYCNQDCVTEYAMANREKGRRIKKQWERGEKREFYQEDKATRKAAAIRWCHKYILLRDAGKPCISCGAPWGSVRFSAGHFVTAGSCTALRFDERNIHGQCWYNCNKNRSGNIVAYRRGLIERYGDSLVRFLEGPQPVVDITVDWYRGIEEKYKAKCKEFGIEQGRKRA